MADRNYTEAARDNIDHAADRTKEMAADARDKMNDMAQENTYIFFLLWL
jgi:hypothetical protein